MANEIPCVFEQSRRDYSHLDHFSHATESNPQNIVHCLNSIIYLIVFRFNKLDKAVMENTGKIIDVISEPEIQSDLDRINEKLNQIKLMKQINERLDRVDGM